MRFLRKFMEKGTVFFVSHDTGAVVNLCSYALLLSHGQIKASGSPRQITELYLESFYEEVQGDIKITRDDISSSDNKHNLSIDLDVRHEIINQSTLRNDIEVFKFELENPGFGTGRAVINLATFYNHAGKSLSMLEGGEEVFLEITCHANEQLIKPIVGFQFKDRLGQVIFADNTYISYQFSSFNVSPGSEFSARFEFRMPILPTGDYSLTVALAEGTQENHVQHHWIHDALMIKVHASSVCHGLIGVAMKDVSLKIREKNYG